MYAWQFAKAQFVAKANGWTKFVSMQNQYNLVYREEEREVIPCCLDQGVGLIPWSPLARGFLAGNRAKDAAVGGETQRAKTDDFSRKLYFTPSDFAVVDRVSEVAKARGIPNVQIALAVMGLKQSSGVASPIIGASKPGHLEDAVAALSVKLSEEEVKRMEEPYVPHRILDHE